MKKLSALVISLCVGSAAATAGAQTQLTGSDTLEGVTECILADPDCTGTGTLEYVGGGSTTGENAMAAGTQEIAPMSRFLDNSACGTAQAESECENVAFDGIVIAVDDIVAASCPDARSSGTIVVTDQNSLDDNTRGDCFGQPSTCVPATETGIQCTDCDPGTNNYVLPTAAPARWRDVLRIVFAGMSKNAGNNVANKQCNSDLRHTLVNSWGNFFQNGCTAGNCTVLEHAWRRSDLSGTTDTFLTLLGLPAVAAATGTQPTPPFCNGYGNRSSSQNAVQDNDPIRRRCKPTDDACGADGATGTFFGPGTLGLVQAVYVPSGASVAEAYPTTACSPGSFRYQDAPFNSSTMCPNAQRSNFGRCLTPRISSTGSCACLNPQDNIPGVGTPESTDGRAYNRFPRRSDCTLLTDADGREVEGASYRFDTTCQEPDATTQIGCLVASNSCTIGFAGREATALTGSEPLRLDGQAPSPDSQITSLTYPLSRKLYLCSIKGFENVVDPEQAALASCFMNQSILAPCVTSNGFVLVPPSGDSICEDFNEVTNCAAASNANACL